VSGAWTWVLAAASLTAGWLMGSKRPAAWPATLAVNVLGGVYFAATGQAGLVALEAAYVAVNVRGWRAWTRTPPEAPRPLADVERRRREAGLTT